MIAVFDKSAGRHKVTFADNIKPPSVILITWVVYVSLNLMSNDNSFDALSSSSFFCEELLPTITHQHHVPAHAY